MSIRVICKMIQGIRASSDGDIDPDGRCGLNRANDGMREAAGRETSDEPVKMLADEVYTMSEAIKSLEKLYETRDITTTASIEELFTTLKTLSHNQTILENKLEDALKNQMNTDVLVNSLNSRMNQLSTTVANLSKVASSGAANASRSDSSQSVATNGTEQSRPPSVRRGPGRPRKDGTSRFTDNSRLQVNPVKISLPTGAVQVSKAKKYFVDPNAPPEPIPVVKSEPQEVTDAPAIPAKRKRGRPPKKRTVDTMVAQKNEVKNDAKPKEDVVEETPREKTPQPAEHELVLLQPSEPLEPVMPTEQPMAIATASPSMSVSPPITSRSSSPSSHIANLIPSAAATAETTDNPENENDKVGTIPTENPIITTRIIGPLARKRLLGATADSDNIMIEMSSSSVAPDNGLESSSNISRQQKELDKRRDSREKMLVNMKYSDREKAKSFMESNKKLLKAMREEERRKRMTALINGSSSVSPSEQPSPSATPTEPVQESAFQADNALQRSKKIGISSMLNNDGTAALIENPEELLSRERSHEADFQDFTDDEDEDDEDDEERYRKRISSNQSPSPSTHLFDNSPAFEKEGTLSTRKGESQASLILASPIELLCRDGFFYQRDNPKVPITTGAYLGFKYKSKEDELVKLNDNHRDFVDKTRHERMNAHFLRLDIECETENAFAILSKTTLTEKYVNSLEYFLMEFRWENKLVGLGLKLRESKRTWQRRKALFTLFEFWRDQSRRKRNFKNYTILHAVKEMENYRIFINRSVSWFYNHITLLKMILYDLCDNVDTQWREWMFNKDEALPTQGVNNVNDDNINEAIDNVLTLDFLDDGTQNNQVKSSKVIPPTQ